VTPDPDIWPRVRPLLPAAALREQMPVPAWSSATIDRARGLVRAILGGTDDRLLVISGPCSVHDPSAAVDYAGRLAALSRRYTRDLVLVMRVYVEKPRTVTGWKGLVNDPGLDGSYDMLRGLRLARLLLLDIAALGLPAACEWVYPVTAQYLADLFTWGAIGARTAESPVHRQLASGLGMPVGFKNSTDGDIQVAIEACMAAANGHTFIGVTADSTPAVISTPGNPDCHIVLRGGRRSGPNFEGPYVRKALDLAAGAGLGRKVIVDASHDNSRKDHLRQAEVAAALAEQVADGEVGLAGVMLESFLVAGRQEPGDPATLTYGQSITDACMDWQTTAGILDTLAAAVRRRRTVVAGWGGAG
jgi:3-deoxy-7-phosphoheptulonate synthase